MTEKITSQNAFRGQPNVKCARQPSEQTCILGVFWNILEDVGAAMRLKIWIFYFK